MQYSHDSVVRVSPTGMSVSIVTPAVSKLDYPRLLPQQATRYLLRAGDRRPAQLPAVQ